MPRLPQDIIEAILSRVSMVKSLLRFRCVSKSWCSIISSKRFIKTHLQISIKNAIPFSDQDIIEHNYMHLNGIRKAYSSGSLAGPYFITNMDLENKEIELVAKDFMEEYSNVSEGNSKSSWFVGCSNGLSCLFINEEIYSWNPCTRQSNVVPLAESESDFQVESLGFGFDEINDDYKVLAQLIDCDAAGIFKFVLTVYSFKTDSWKILKKIVDGMSEDVNDCDLLDKLLAGQLGKSGKLLGGKLHWGSGDEIWSIVSFDLSSEVFGMVEQPSYVGDEWTYPTLEVVKECLCVLNFHFNQEHWLDLDVWVLKEYGAKESWYKAFRFRRDQYIPHYPGIHPLYITEELEILCSYNL